MEATLNTPPNTQAFDPANRGVSLVASGARSVQPAIPAALGPAPISELGHLSNLVTAIFGAVNTVNPTLVTPSRTVRAATPEMEGASLVPSPSDIPRFLKHASTDLGVRNALAFESPLRRKGYGPDILPDVDDAALVALGISEGDVLRLKNGSRKWWNGPDAKRKLAEDDDSFFSNTLSNRSRDTSDDHVDKRYHYELLFPEGGGTRYNGPPIKKGDRGFHDDSTTYWDERQRKMVPIPVGYTAPPYNAPDDSEEELGVYHG
jgi:hypothetical protein